jgi:hypothetical protein
MRASWYCSTLALSLLAPWRLGERAGRSAHRAPILLYAAVHVGIGASLAALLSSWTYLAGKGLILGLDQMDLGQDDLPFDSRSQVLLGLLTSVLVWSLLLGLVCAACLLVADRLYAADRAGFRRAALSAGLATAWFVVGATTILAVNGVLHGELFHPAAAIRAHAQLRQRGWPPAATLTVHDRAMWLGAGFTLLWASTLCPPNVRFASARRSIAFALLAVTGCWLVGWAVLRALPWAAIEAFAG